MAVCAARPLSDMPGQDAALAVLAAILGAGADGRLGASLREKHGLTYGASADILRRRYARVLLACTRIDSDRADTGIQLLLQALAELRGAPPRPEELARAKSILIGHLESGQDNVGASLSTWLTALDLRDSTPVHERIAAIRAVTAEEVHGLAARALEPESIQIVLSGMPGAARAAVRANGLGRLETVKLVR
jgi:zinc protease